MVASSIDVAKLDDDTLQALKEFEKKLEDAAENDELPPGTQVRP